MHILVANNSCLNGLKGHTIYWKIIPGLLPGASEVTDLKREHSTTMFLDQYNSSKFILKLILTPKDKCSYHTITKEASLYGKLKLLLLQRPKDHEELFSHGYIYNATTICKAQGTVRRGGRKF